MKQNAENSFTAILQCSNINDCCQISNIYRMYSKLYRWPVDVDSYGEVRYICLLSIVSTCLAQGRCDAHFVS